MPAQTSASCAVERRLRSLTTINAADLRHAAMQLAKRQTLARRHGLEEAKRNRDTLRTEIERHHASCETCFKSGSSV